VGGRRPPLRPDRGGLAPEHRPAPRRGAPDLRPDLRPGASPRLAGQLAGLLHGVRRALELPRRRRMDGLPLPVRQAAWRATNRTACRWSDGRSGPRPTRPA
jgi:hypothetical protein